MLRKHSSEDEEEVTSESSDDTQPKKDPTQRSYKKWLTFNSKADDKLFDIVNNTSANIKSRIRAAVVLRERGRITEEDIKIALTILEIGNSTPESLELLPLIVPF